MAALAVRHGGSASGVGDNDRARQNANAAGEPMAGGAGAGAREGALGEPGGEAGEVQRSGDEQGYTDGGERQILVALAEADPTGGVDNLPDSRATGS